MFTKTLTALAVLPFIAGSALAGPCVRHYTVKAGDYCDSISAAQNVSTYQLATINAGIIDEQCSNLVPDKDYCLGYENEDCKTTYVVVADDTCEGITAKNSVNSTILSLNNPQINEACDNIYIGEVLCTSTTVQVPPPAADGHVAATAIPSGATAAAAATQTATDDDDGDDDDDDLPYCDEL